MVAAGAESKWQIAPNGGELRPELQETIFSESFPSPAVSAQDFLTCVEVTHASYMLLNYAFVNDGYIGADLDRARVGATALGYAYHVSAVRISGTTVGDARVSITVANGGVAPFYYPLSLSVGCGGDTAAILLPGVEEILGENDSRLFELALSDVLTLGCTDSIELSLSSDFTYAARPVRWSQGDGDAVLTVGLRDGLSPQCSGFGCRRGGRPANVVVVTATALVPSR
jgi:hypothetical protein